MQREIQAQINCSSVVKGEVRRVVRIACNVRASWIEREGGRTRANEGEFVARFFYISVCIRMADSPFSVSGRRISLSHPDIIRVSVGPATTLPCVLTGNLAF